MNLDVSGKLDAVLFGGEGVDGMDAMERVGEDQITMGRAHAVAAKEESEAVEVVVIDLLALNGAYEGGRLGVVFKEPWELKGVQVRSVDHETSPGLTYYGEMKVVSKFEFVVDDEEEIAGEIEPWSMFVWIHGRDTGGIKALL